MASSDSLSPLRSLLSAPLTPETWQQVVSLLLAQDQQPHDAAQPSAARRPVSAEPLEEPPSSVTGSWRLVEASYWAGELRSAADIDWSASWRELRLGALKDAHLTGGLRWEQQEQLRAYLTLFPDGCYLDADLPRGPLDFTDCSDPGEPEEEARWRQYASTFPVGTPTSWLQSLLDGRPSEQGVLRPAVALSDSDRPQEGLLYEASDGDELWQRDIVSLEGPDRLSRVAYSSYQWIYFQTLELSYQRVR